ncbi:MAG: hypothetical protein V3R50_00660 [Gammaproteobacteria bacterium]
MNASWGARLIHGAVLSALLLLALFFPYWWFGVVPFSADYSVSQAQIDELLKGKNLIDYYAEPLAPITDAELAIQKEAFTWCRFCHTLKQGGENRVGPNLYRIFGKPAAVVGGFYYSDAFLEAQAQGLVWTPETMAAFIADPHAMVPGNRMRYPPSVGYETNPEKERIMLDYLLRMTR